MRVRILTIAPDNWTLKKTAEEFGTTIYAVRKATELRETEGLFCEIPIKKRKRLTDIHVNKVFLQQ